jgi:iron(III) transport system substrate-binding protein
MPTPLRISAVVFAVFCSLVPGTLLAQSAPASMALYEGADREQRVLSAARQEGSVTIYSSLNVEDLTDLAAAFDKKYGIKLKFWRAGSEKVLQRIVTEARAARHEFDIVETNGPELEALHREKLLQPAVSTHFADLVPQAIQPHREWIGTRLNMFVQVYNTKLVKKEDFPKTYQDLLDPKWKGRLAIEAEDMDWFSTVVKDLGEEKGIKLFRDIVATNGISVRKGHTLLAGLVASGEVPFALTVYSHNADKLKRKGAPIEWDAISPAIVRANGMALAKRPAHPNAAILFYDFMLAEGQAIIMKNEYLPANRKVGSLPEKLRLKFVDAASVLDEGAKWEKLYNEIFTRQSRQ